MNTSRTPICLRYPWGRNGHFSRWTLRPEWQRFGTSGHERRRNYVEADGSTTRRVARSSCGPSGQGFRPVTYDHLVSRGMVVASFKAATSSWSIPRSSISPDDFYANVRFKVSASKDDRLLMQKGEDGPTFYLKLVTELGETYLQAQIKTDAGQDSIPSSQMCR